MKKIIIFLFTLMPLQSFCQDSLNKKMIIAGNELQVSSKMYSIGTVAEIGGAVIAIVGGTSYPNNKSAEKIIPFVGGFIAFAGFLCQANAFDHIKQAGIYLTGNEIIIPINKRKYKK